MRVIAPHRLEPEPRPALAAALRIRLWWSGTIANVVGAVVIFVAVAVVGGSDRVPEDREGELVAVFVATLVVGVGVVATGLTRAARPFLAAVDEGRTLTGAARTTLLAFPSLNAVASALTWLAGAPIFAFYTWWRLGNEPPSATALAITIAAGGLTTGATVFLLVERALRPLLAEAFAVEAPTRPRSLAVGPRLLLAWLLGSAVPLVLTAMVLASPDGDLDDVRRSGIAWVVVALIAGFAVTTRAARSVAEPLGALRAAMSRLAGGDLDATVEVNDASEIGLLQAGFNDMASGLRDRERMRDVFGRHVGTEVAEHSLAGDLRLGGERQHASVLFLDLIGFTELASRRSPESVVSTLNDVFAVVVDATEAEGGWVNQFQGDAALCVFGPPSGHPDHAGAALRAGVRIIDGVRELARTDDGLDAGIGISTGEVVAGNVGTAERFEYTVIGDPVNEAARLTEEAKAHPSRVLASEKTVGRAGSSGWQRAGSRRLRGRPEPTEAYEPAPAHRSGERRPSVDG